VYQPLATAIVGDRPVQVSTSGASRRALAKVGKRAATTGDTIHLATPRPSTEVLAHELTHIAHPSPVARFFDDDDHSPEERQAERVAAIMRRSTILPRTASAGSGGVAGTRPTVAPASDTVRRQVSGGTVSAAALASELGATSSPTVQRVIGGHRAGGRATTTTTQPTQPAQQPAATPSDTNDATQAGLGSMPRADRAMSDLSVQFEQILELLEERVMRELERRGGRFRGGF
jgi:hypothetical protein